MKITIFDKVKFIVIFILGIFAFLIPFSIPGVPGLEESNILISHINTLIKEYAYQPLIIFTLIVQVLIIISACLGIYKRITNKEFNHEFLNELCSPTIPMIIMKIFGSFFFILLALPQIGVEVKIPESNEFLRVLNQMYAGITNPDTGGTTFNLVLSLFITFFLGNALLPLLTEFGAVEFVGNLASKMMNKLFNVPGYSAIDAIASFVGDGTIGILVTDRQYQKGYYTQKQAGIIATSFSIVGIAFATLVAEELGFSDQFPIFYGSIVVITIVLALILSRVNFFGFKDTYYDVAQIQPSDHSVGFNRSFEIGVEVCKRAKLKQILINVFKQITTTYIIFVPTIMFVGTIGLIIATYTPLFTQISKPFIPFLDWLGFGNSASVMAPSLFVGIADMYLPTLFVIDPATTVSSAAKFFIGVLSFSQLVFLSETGMILLNTKIGFKLFDVIKLFVIRTLLAIPILLVITYLLSFVGIVSF